MGRNLKRSKNRSIKKPKTLTNKIFKTKPSPVSAPRIHEYAEPDSSTSSPTRVSLIGITLVSSSPLRCSEQKRLDINNIRYEYERMLEEIFLSRPQSSNLQDLIPYKNFLDTVLRIYQYHGSLLNKGF